MSLCLSVCLFFTFLPPTNAFHSIPPASTPPRFPSLPFPHSFISSSSVRFMFVCLLVCLLLPHKYTQNKDLHSNQLTHLFFYSPYPCLLSLLHLLCFMHYSICLSSTSSYMHTKTKIFTPSNSLFHIPYLVFFSLSSSSPSSASFLCVSLSVFLSVFYFLIQTHTIHRSSLLPAHYLIYSPILLSPCLLFSLSFHLPLPPASSFPRPPLHCRLVPPIPSTFTTL